MLTLPNHSEREALYRGAKRGDKWFRAYAKPANKMFNLFILDKDQGEVVFEEHIVLKVTDKSVIVTTDGFVSLRSYEQSLEALQSHFKELGFDKKTDLKIPQTVIRHDGTKRYAAPTKALAMEGLLARLKRKNLILTNQLAAAKAELELAEKEFEKLCKTD